MVKEARAQAASEGVSLHAVVVPGVVEDRRRDGRHPVLPGDPAGEGQIRLSAQGAVIQHLEIGAFAVQGPEARSGEQAPDLPLQVGEVQGGGLPLFPLVRGVQGNQEVPHEGPEGARLLLEALREALLERLPDAGQGLLEERVPDSREIDPALEPREGRGQPGTGLR